MAKISIARDIPKPQEYASDGSDAVGFIQFYGNSPALDLLHGDPQLGARGPLAIGTSPSATYAEQSWRKSQPVEDEAECEEECVESSEVKVVEPVSLSDDGVVNILIAGGADIRHVLKTVAKRALQPGILSRRKLRFFLHDERHETVARHILFLQLINNTTLPARERAETFLSLYGNTLVRDRDNVYVEEIASEIVEMLTDNSEHPLSHLVDLTHLKYKDRDTLQDVVKGWFKNVPFDIEALRDQRCRGYYRERFDYRKNLFDLDYQTHIKPQAGIINWFHYKEFCFSGVAYETRLGSYTVANRTLASYTEGMDRAKGTTVQVRGYWGDIINSPYHAWCTWAHPQDWARLFKIGGSQYKHTENEIAEFNTTGLITEMDTGQAYHLPAESAGEHVLPYQSPLEELRKEDDQGKNVPDMKQDDTAASGKCGRHRQKKRAEWPALSPGFEGIEVVLLAGPLNEVLKKPKYRGLFHRAFVGALGVVPIIEEMGSANDVDYIFRAKHIDSKIRKLPRLEAPEAFGKKRNSSTFAAVMVSGAEVVFETMKYQAHFESSTRLAYRHRIAQFAHLVGWELRDERLACPRIEDDMKERRCGEVEKDASDFMRFVAASMV